MLEFLQRLTFTLKSECLAEDVEPHPLFIGSGKNITGLTPFLDNWYHPKEYWYVMDIISGLEQILNAKVFCNRQLSMTDEGLMYIGSEEMRNAEQNIENAIREALHIQR